MTLDCTLTPGVTFIETEVTELSELVPSCYQLAVNHWWCQTVGTCSDLGDRTAVARRVVYADVTDSRLIYYILPGNSASGVSAPRVL